VFWTFCGLGDGCGGAGDDGKDDITVIGVEVVVDGRVSGDVELELHEGSREDRG
jgi:hypothetical protein